MKEERQLYSEIAEKNVLASCMAEDGEADLISKLLVPSDFYIERHKTVYETILRLLDKEHSTDSISVSARLKQAGNDSLLDWVWDADSYRTNALSHAQMVKDFSLLRALVQAGRSITSMANNWDGSVAEALSRSEKLLLSIGDRNIESSVGDFSSASTVSQNALNAATDAFNARESGANINRATGFGVIDDMVPHWGPGDYIVLAGRPSMGKSAFALKVALHFAKSYKESVLFFSLEMPSTQLGSRMLSLLSGVNLQKIISGTYSQSEFQLVSKAHDEVKKLDLLFDDSAPITSSQISAITRRAKQKHQNQLSLIVIDYLQLMEPDIKGNSRVEDVTRMSAAMKTLAKENQCPVLVLSQLNRSAEYRSTNKRPGMSDLRDSGAIEQDADIILLLYREEVYNSNTAKKGVAEINVAKNRNGATGVIHLSFHKQTTTFTELTLLSLP